MDKVMQHLATNKDLYGKSVRLVCSGDVVDAMPIAEQVWKQGKANLGIANMYLVAKDHNGYEPVLKLWA